MLGSGIRRFDGEALGGRRLARTPPRRVTRWLAASTIAPPAPEAIAVLSSAGDDSRPHHVFRPQNRGVVIQADEFTDLDHCILLVWSAAYTLFRPVDLVHLVDLFSNLSGLCKGRTH